MTPDAYEPCSCRVTRARLQLTRRRRLYQLGVIGTLLVWIQSQYCHRRPNILWRAHRRADGATARAYGRGRSEIGVERRAHALATHRPARPVDPLVVQKAAQSRLVEPTVDHTPSTARSWRAAARSGARRFDAAVEQLS